MKNHTNYSQLYLRLAIGLGFIYPVLDRIGWVGAAGETNIAWGNWQAFLDYTHVLMPILPRGLSDVMGLIATLAEVLFGVLLIVGFKTRYVAIGSFILTLSFAICMTITLGIKAPFNYSVFAVSAGALLLSAIPYYRWSIDNLKK
jgi:uncharacterized membrane protein YphA (DoxX/SURF4 family)